MSVKTSAGSHRTANEEIGQYLAMILADTYITYLKTQNFHWNLQDARFESLHLFFENLYKQLAESVDEIAERIRMIRLKSPGTMEQFLKLTSLEEGDCHASGNEMIQALCNDREILIRNIHPMIQKATDLGDDGTADLLIQQLRMHEKAAWMLRSHLLKD